MRTVGGGVSALELARVNQVSPTMPNLIAALNADPNVTDFAIYDPSVLTSLWKDTARTQQVTADGDAVAAMDDISGKGHHMSQATAASRPLYKTGAGLHWILGDGSDDWIVSNPLFGLGTVWAHVGGWQSSSAGQRSIFTTSHLSRSAVTKNSPSTYYTMRNRADTGDAQIVNVATLTTPHLLSIDRGTGPTTTGRINGANPLTVDTFNDSAGTQGIALFNGVNNVTNSPLNASFYCGLFVSLSTGPLSTGIRTMAERVFAPKVGVTL